MHHLRRFLICCLIWVGFLPGRDSLRAQSTPTPASRAQAELERQAQEYWRKEAAKSSASEGRERAMTEEERARSLARSKKAAGNATTAPGPKVQYTTNPRPGSKTEPSAEERARMDRLARIESEVARRRAERSGESPTASRVANKPEAISPVPPPAPGAPVVVPSSAGAVSAVSAKSVEPGSRDRLAADRDRLKAQREAQAQKAEYRRMQKEAPVSAKVSQGPSKAELAELDRAHQAALDTEKKALAETKRSEDTKVKVAREQQEAERKARLLRLEAEVAAKRRARTVSPAPAPATLPVSATRTIGLSPEEERKARELLRHTLADVEREESAAKKGGANAAKTKRDSASEARAQKKAAYERAKQDRAQAQRAAREQAAQVKVSQHPAKPTPVAASKAAAITAETAAPRAPTAPRTKAEKLSNLLKSYTRSQDPISAEQYHRERAQIIAEP